MDTLDILDCNHRVTSVYGYTKTELVNKSFLDLIRENEREAQALKIRTRQVINQATHMDHQGNTLFVDIWISPSEYPGRKALLVTTSDITQRLQTEQQLIQASKMATLGEMATGVAHELNQPLSVIKTASSFFVKKINKEEEIKKDTLHNMLLKVDSNVDRASKIINHMRQFARKSDMDLEKIQVNEVLQRAFEIFSQQLKVRGIEVIWDIGDDLPKIMADPGRLEQIFINLLINARDAIEEKWAKKGRQTEDNAITLITRTDGKNVFVEVADTGVGIPDAILDKLFEPFFTTKEVGKGTGLGLSISYGIIKDCGGNIEASSINGEGACFILIFPIAQAGKAGGNI
jgi:histidine kinase